MIGLFAILTLACVATAENAPTRDTPQYVQANEQFTSAKMYISENLPPSDYKVKSVQFSFAILTGTLGGLAEAQHRHSRLKPIEVINHMVPYTWSHYNVVQHTYQQLVNEATVKTAIVTNLIDTLCGSDSVDECNRKVDAKVRSSPMVFGGSARLLLALGDVGAMVNNNAEKIDNLAKNHLVIPYLIKYADDMRLRDFVYKLVSAYHELRKIHFRRLFDMD